jgi:hypothetical protein
MSGAGRVALAFRTTREPGEAAALAQRSDAIMAAGEDLAIVQIGRLLYAVEDWCPGRYAHKQSSPATRLLVPVRRAFEAAIARHLAAAIGCGPGGNTLNVNPAIGFD